MFNFIPPQFQIAALVGGIFLSTAIGFSSGWVVNGYRLNANYAETIRQKDELLHDYDLKLVKQNAAVDLLKIEKWAANQRYEDAAKALEKILKINAARQAQADNIKPVDCRSMVEALKSLPR